MLPLLTVGGKDHPSFHVVAPSLPGFGFSEAPSKPGFKGPQYAEAYNVVSRCSRDCSDILARI